MTSGDSSLPRPATGVALIPVPGEPTQDEYRTVAEGLLRMMPPELDRHEQAKVLAGALISAWRHGFWVANHAGMT